jgi:hypothetical protein
MAKVDKFSIIGNLFNFNHLCFVFCSILDSLHAFMYVSIVFNNKQTKTNTCRTKDMKAFYDNRMIPIRHCDAETFQNIKSSPQGV